MSQSIELEKIKARIRNLMNRTTENGASESEMFTAMAKVSDLMEQFSLNMTDVMLVEEKCVTKAVDTGVKQRNIQYDVLTAIGKFCDCRVWINRGTSIKLYLFGLESDVLMAEYLLHTILDTFNQSVKEFKQSDDYVNFGSHRKVLFANFKLGFSITVRNRLVDLAQTRTSNLKTATTGTSLVIVDKMKRVEEEFSQMGMRLRNTYTKNNFRGNNSAIRAGQDAGNKVNLSRPVGGSNKATSFLK